ncbi:MAG: hypothetical protein FJ028_03280 [Chloroflexi bacterium]|nr:hypothetical protein [Chloroflexota bacterium]
MPRVRAIDRRADRRGEAATSRRGGRARQARRRAGGDYEHQRRAVRARGGAARSQRPAHDPRWRE